jgi:hypothetical protein
MRPATVDDLRKLARRDGGHGNHVAAVIDDGAADKPLRPTRMALTPGALLAPRGLRPALPWRLSVGIVPAVRRSTFRHPMMSNQRCINVGLTVAPMWSPARSMAVHSDEG